MRGKNGVDAIVFRPGRPGDYPAALAIQRRAYAAKEVPLYGSNLPPLLETPKTLAEEIAAGKRLFVGECEGEIVASIRIEELEDGEIHFCRLSVEPARQGRGIGQRLILATEAACPEAKSFVLDCGEQSVENFHIYRKLGYLETGRAFQVPDGPKCLEMRKKKRPD
ncbi:MAG: GNAT family N-acetyltransferase [Planctomycetota bacterium]|nr:GNAT family N-acetyltransferase [Planctomycetota bacterium]